MKEKGFKCNIENSFFEQTKIGYLGFWLTHDGIKPINRKIEAITNMKPNISPKEVQNFIDVINYYRDMCPRRSHTLAPLTKLMSIKSKFKWEKVKQYAFDEINRIVTSNNLLAYTDFNETFKIHTNDIAFQLGAVISHKGKHIAFYSRKITDSQQGYTAT